MRSRPIKVSSISGKFGMQVDMPNFTEIEETSCGQTDVHTDGQTVPSSESRNTKTKINFKNLARTNLDIVP